MQTDDSNGESGSAAQLIVILGDQLSFQIAALQHASKARDVILMAELMEEASYAAHHRKKLVLVFSAMRHFARALREDGWQVDYLELRAPDNSGVLCTEITRAAQRHQCQTVCITEPAEWRLMQQLQQLRDKGPLTIQLLPDKRFFTDKKEFSNWAGNTKQLRMENFYRHQRRSTGLLMDGAKPVGGRWNFDSENRKPAAGGLDIPAPLRHAPDAITTDVIAIVAQEFADHIGQLEPFWFAVTHSQAEAVFEHFLNHALASFGHYQDAMLSGEPFMFHSLISAYLNIGLLDCNEVCQRAEQAWRDNRAPLNAVEGFIRQILGWREYVRGIYWLQMPDYLQANYFNHQRSLPDFYWDARTDMACLHASIQQTLDEAYAHHIQRLMITGNFALLTGIEPRQLHEWYLAVYADAYEWVELPNTIGMSQFADGGLLGSKPYAASGNYINKMSNYCKSCRYKVSKKTGPDACPFNYLYWYFIDRHAELLAGNHRMAQVVRTWQKMSAERHAEVRSDAAQFLATLDSGPDDLFGH